MSWRHGDVRSHGAQRHVFRSSRHRHDIDVIVDDSSQQRTTESVRQVHTAYAVEAAGGCCGTPVFRLSTPSVEWDKTFAKVVTVITHIAH